MSSDALRVSLSKVADFLRDIGLDPVDVKKLKSVHFDPGVVTVIRFRTGEDGRHVMTADGPATETITIGVDG